MGKRILIVDGSPLVRAGLRAILATEGGLEVCAETGTGSDALGLLRDLQPDLVITDLSLSNDGGLDFIRRLKVQAAGTRILVCCGQSEYLLAERAVRAGASGFVNKTEATEHVIAAVRRVLAGRVWLSHRVVERIVDRLGGAQARNCSAIGGLSDRELAVFGMIGEGLTTRTIAERLDRSVKTVDAHRERIKRKLGVSRSPELIRIAAQWSLDPS